MSTFIPSLGALKSEIDTPALLIDLEALDRNITRMAGYFVDSGVRLRPHAKTHKSVEIARKQIAAGAVGIACAKLGEAEVLADGGIDDILIANQIVGPLKIARLVQLAKRVKLAVAVDQADNVRALSDAAMGAGVTISCLVEVNVGMNRCGVEPGEAALVLARLVASSQGLRFGGIQAYEGHLQNLMPLAEREARACRDIQKAVRSKEHIESHGIPVPVISGAGTGTFLYTMGVDSISEVQAGSYATMDGSYKAHGAEFETALTVLATVISRPSVDIAVIDAGMKAMTHESGLPTPLLEGVTITGLSEEHGVLSLVGPATCLKVGDKIEILPSHGCTTINLHDSFHVVEGDQLVDVWKIAARGRTQ